jgi:hypothetical protein
MFINKPIRSTMICLKLYTVRTLPMTRTKLPTFARGFNMGGGSSFTFNSDEVRFASTLGCGGCCCGWVQSITAVPSSTSEKQNRSTFQSHAHVAKWHLLVYMIRFSYTITPTTIPTNLTLRQGTRPSQKKS